MSIYLFIVGLSLSKFRKRTKIEDNKFSPTLHALPFNQNHRMRKNVYKQIEQHMHRHIKPKETMSNSENKIHNESNIYIFDMCVWVSINAVPGLHERWS